MASPTAYSPASASHVIHIASSPLTVASATSVCASPVSASSITTSPSPSPLPRKRRGFDSRQFRQIERDLADPSSPTATAIATATIATATTATATTATTVAAPPPGRPASPSERLARMREVAYRVVDSPAVSALVVLCLVLDLAFFCTFFVILLLPVSPLPPLFVTLYAAVDWVVTLVLVVEVHLRIFSYGPSFYFRDPLSAVEFAVSVLALILLLAHRRFGLRVLLVVRLVRAAHAPLSAVRCQVRRMRRSAHAELEALALLVHRERASVLRDWHLPSASITVGKRAGAGGFGVVFSGLFRGTMVAIKQLLRPDVVSSAIEHEARTLVRLRHPNVILFMGLVKEPARLWIVTEFCSRGSLRDLLDAAVPLSRARILKLALGAARGLAYLHGQTPPVLHLDLKTSNILISSGWEAKLGDFGLSRTITSARDRTFSGTLQYSAPEVLRAADFSPAADVYSFGICLWELFANDVPFRGVAVPTLMWGVIDKGWRPPIAHFVARKPTSALLKRASTRDEHGRRRLPLTIERMDKLPFLKHELTTLHSGSRTSQRADIDVDPDAAADCVRRSLSHRPTHHHMSAADDAPGAIGRACSDLCGTGSIGRLASSVPVANKVDGGVETCCEDEPVLAIRERMTGMSSTRTNWRTGRAMRGENEVAETAERSGGAAVEHVESVGRQQERKGSNLDGLSRKVTAALKLFDDRPPLLRRREDGSSKSSGVGSNGGGGCDGVTCRDTVSGGGNGVGRRPDVDDDAADDIGLQSLLAVGAMGGAAAQAEMEEGETRQAVYVPEEYVELMTRCWAEEADDRPSANELVWRLVTLMDEERRARMR